MARWPGHGPGDAPVEEADPDLALVAQAQEHPAAFEAIVLRYRLPLLRYFHARLGDWADAEDAVQEALLDVYVQLPRFTPRGHASFRAWLFAIAHNAKVDVQRRRAIRRQETLPETPGWADPAPSPEDEALREDTSAELRRLLASLTDDQRAVVQLRAADLATDEIASALGLTQSAVRKAQQRAFERLRALAKTQIESSATP